MYQAIKVIVVNATLCFMAGDKNICFIVEKYFYKVLKVVVGSSGVVGGSAELLLYLIECMLSRTSVSIFGS
jgi:hypothetical protein